MCSIWNTHRGKVKKNRKRLYKCFKEMIECKVLHWVIDRRTEKKGEYGKE